MRNKIFAWAFMLALLCGVPAMVYAQDTQSSSDPAIQSRTSAYTGGWDLGYRNGYNDGKSHHDSGTEFDPKDAPGYKGYRSSYDDSMGKRSHYKEGYKDGFKLGYQDGYSGVMSRFTSESAPESQARVETEEPVMEHTDESSAAMQETAPAESTPDTAQSYDTRQSQELPRSLPRTASSFPLLALLGLGAIASSLVFRALKKDAA